jgi:hypothetical protein
VGVTQVQFYLNGVLQSTDTTSPYSWSWNTASVGNGSHTLQSRASDAAGNIGTSSNVTVTVSNVSNPVTVFSDGAESSSTTFVATYTASSTRWTRRSGSSYAGTYHWRAGSSSGGNYGNNGDARLTTPTLNLSGATTATLTYAFKHSTELNYDYFEVRISTDGGTNWTNLSRVSGNSAGYSAWATLKTVNLNAYAGMTNVKVQFRFTTDVSVTGVGVMVDAVKVVKQ